MALVVASLTVALVLLWSGQAWATFPQTENVSVPANGFATASSSTLPASAKQGTITATPATSDDDDFFDHLKFALAQAPTKSEKLLTCLIVGMSDEPYDDADVDYEEDGADLYIIFVNACIHLAGILPTSSVSHSATAPSKGCFRTDKAVSITVTHKNGKYTVHVKGKTHKPKAKGKAVITCKPKNKGLRFTLKPRKKGTKLRKAIGPNLLIGFLNPGTTSGTVKTTFAVK